TSASNGIPNQAPSEPYPEKRAKAELSMSSFIESVSDTISQGIISQINPVLKEILEQSIQKTLVGLEYQIAHTIQKQLSNTAENAVSSEEDKSLDLNALIES